MGQGDRIVIVVGLLALAMVARTLGAWWLWDPELVPDTGLYAAGGLSLFPSPLGTVIGTVGGLPLLVVVNALAAGALVVLAAALAATAGGRAWLAAVAVHITPLGLWTIFAGVDALGAALILGALLAHLHGRRRTAAALAVTGCAAHAAVIPIVLVGVLLVARAWRLGAAFALAALGFALVTPYGDALGDVPNAATGFVWGLATLGIAGLPYLPLAGRLLRRTVLSTALAACAAGTLVCAAIMAAGDDPSTSGRYALPLSILAASAIAVPRARLELDGGAHLRQSPLVAYGIGAALVAVVTLPVWATLGLYLLAVA